MSKRVFKPTGKGGTMKRRAAQVSRLRAARQAVSRHNRRVAAISRPGELKGVDTDITLASTQVLTTTNTNGGSFVLNLVQAGTGSWQRIGRKIWMDSLRLKGSLMANLDDTAAAAPLQTLTMRMVVVYDSQPSSGAIPTFDTIFGRTVQDGTESCSFLDPLRYDNTGRFRVIRDKTYTFQASSIASGGGGGGNASYDFDEFIELGGLETIFSGQSTPMTIADISTGGLYIYFRADTNTGGTAQAQVRNYSFARLRYRDQ